jgi:MFS family permease
MTESTSLPKDIDMHSRSGGGWRDVYILAAMRGLSVAGDILAATALTLLLQKDGDGGYAVMALLLAATVPVIVLMPVTGAFADRFSSRALMVIVAGLQGVVCLAMTQTKSPVALIALVVLLSSGIAFTSPVFGGLPSAMVSKEDIPRASSISQTMAMVGMVAAPAVAGILSARSGVRLPLIFDAASFGLVMLGGMAIKTRLHSKQDTREHAPQTDAVQVQKTYRVWSDRFLLSILVLSCAVMASACIVDVVIVFFVRDTFHASAQVYGLIMSSWMVGMVPGGLLARRLKHWSFETILMGCFLCIGLGIVGAALAPGVWWIVPFYVIGGFGNGAQASVTHILFNLRVPHSHRGRAFAALNAVSNVGPTAGFVLGGMLLSFLASRYVVLTAGAFVLLAMAVFGRGVLRQSARDSVVDLQPTTAGS